MKQRWTSRHHSRLTNLTKKDHQTSFNNGSRLVIREKSRAKQTRASYGMNSPTATGHAKTTQQVTEFVPGKKKVSGMLREPS